MNLSTCSTSTNPKNIILEFKFSSRGKCQCGKTKDSDGNCDGSHSSKLAITWLICSLMSLVVLTAPLGLPIGFPLVPFFNGILFYSITILFSTVPSS